MSTRLKSVGGARRSTYWVDVLAVSTQQQRRAMHGAPGHSKTCGLTCSWRCLPLMPVAVCDAIACAATGCPESAGAGFMPLFLDPVLFLRQGVSGAAASFASRFVAAYILYVGAMLARETVDPSRLEALRLPSDSGMARASPFCAIDWGSGDEVWLRPEPPCARPPLVAPARPTRSARKGARPEPSGYGAIDD